MKTLDEVIEELQYWDTCDEYPESFYDFEVVRDALHYLREYRKLDSLDAVASQEDDNPPLTWDELKEMEGKPVWIEEIGGKYATPYWAIHNGIMDGYDGDENLYLQPFDVLTKYTLGKTWNAYRKERE